MFSFTSEYVCNMRIVKFCEKHWQRSCPYVKFCLCHVPIHDGHVRWWQGAWGFTVAILAQAQAHCSFLMPCRSSSVKVFLTSLSSILNSLDYPLRFTAFSRWSLRHVSGRPEKPNIKLLDNLFSRHFRHFRDFADRPCPQLDMRAIGLGLAAWLCQIYIIV